MMGHASSNRSGQSRVNANVDGGCPAYGGECAGAAHARANGYTPGQGRRVRRANGRDARRVNDGVRG